MCICHSEIVSNETSWILFSTINTKHGHVKINMKCVRKKWQQTNPNWRKLVEIKLWTGGSQWSGADEEGLVALDSAFWANCCIVKCPVDTSFISSISQKKYYLVMDCQQKI